MVRKNNIIFQALTIIVKRKRMLESNWMNLGDQTVSIHSQDCLNCVNLLVVYVVCIQTEISLKMSCNIFVVSLTHKSWYKHWFYSINNLLLIFDQQFLKWNNIQCHNNFIKVNFNKKHPYHHQYNSSLLNIILIRRYPQNHKFF